MFSPSVQTVRATPAPRPQRKKQWRTFEVDIVLKTVDTGRAVQVRAMVDSGATGLFLDRRFVDSTGWNTRKLPRALPVLNVDGTPNINGPITHEIDLMMIFGEHQERANFSITTLTHSVILGLDWLRRHNPDINWCTGEVRMRRCPKSCQRA